MTDAINPYGNDLGDHDAREALHKTPNAIAAVVAAFGDSGLGRRLAPGKWTVTQILVHLAQVELMFQSRLRLALTTPGLVVQPFDQDDFMRVDPSSDGRAALDAYTSLRRFALPLIDGLRPDVLGTALRHPEYGDISVGWLLACFAGHELRHLGQLQQIAATGSTGSRGSKGRP